MLSVISFFNKYKLSLISFSCLLLVSCSTISPFNQRAYEQAVTIKVDALSLMDKATAETFEENRHEVTLLKEQVEKAYEYARGLPKNEIVTKQWEIIKNPSRNSLGGFLVYWERNKTLSKTFVTDMKGIISDGFDQVIELESGKVKPSN
ncbi:hypothetical protein H4F46_17615 [Pectobacterium brasiliense]|uniref:hypothetical protein n=1 Tax=Pectobacterium TaxID=122277 RepID=UPI001968D6B8|nr:hypothetical protein [Pectobacterium brasiliense]MBN3116709.1 hypothetical protein [Pectobacterium brasiliense]MDY4350182.1 hypothetical protein [Pectobacterium brasiliense]